MNSLLVVAFFSVIGLFIGSFLNVVIYRIGTGRSMIKGRSKCFCCSKVLTGKELVPVVSFLVQGGKCTKCLSKISVQYPIIELLTGFVFGAIAYVLMPVFANTIIFAALFAVYSFVFSSLIVISVYDIKHKMIPTSVVYTGIIVGLLSSLLVFRAPLLTVFTSVIFCAAPFALLSFLSKERWMGWGDTLIGILIGSLFSWQRGVAAIMLSFWIGAVFALVMMLVKKGSLKMKSEVPFGPFLAIALFVVFVFQLDVFSILSWFRIGN
ncbi:MAG: prepilin peptidase [bacterium]